MNILYSDDAIHRHVEDEGGFTLVDLPVTVSFDHADTVTEDREVQPCLQACARFWSDGLVVAEASKFVPEIVAYRALAQTLSALVTLLAQSCVEREDRS